MTAVTGTSRRADAGCLYGLNTQHDPGRARRSPTSRPDREAAFSAPVNVVIRAKFNPNLYAYWFSSVMQVVNNITMLAVILTGAALIREREQGTTS